MLGLSKKVARSELLRIKHTGTPKAFTDWVKKNILDYGHEVEALARPLVEKIIGDDLYPVTCSDEDGGGKLSASCDGLTLLEDTAFEHKQWNTDLAASVSNNVLPDDHMPQCQQIMLVTGAQRVIFTVSDGTPERLVWMEVLPDANWFERIRAGWAQFDRDLAEYTLPTPAPTVVAEAVQDLPAVTVQVNGQIEVRENFTIFEVALRDFIENKLIREPQTDQDFADLDLQIKAMKKAEETLNAAESMMLAQIQRVDEAKRQKDMLSRLVRDNRLMAEKLLASEKERRRTEKVVAARQAFADHVTELQREISGVRLDIVVPDFAGAIKGLKTMTSIQDKLDTALANGKIAADQQAADLRTKLAWLDTNAADYRALLADLQQLVAKPFDDFKLAVTARIDAHKKAEEARLEAERERIRREEAARLEAEQRQQKEPPAKRKARQSWRRRHRVA
ncbi:Phage-related protein [Dickeya aquatica]|uniref:Phage-related protein n=2 Tax=Dickeya aquatica TaxID=1401087 RepID=A0A375ABT7_9GAMM|nr:Phage-related protein [Dickeya aquatica]